MDHFKSVYNMCDSQDLELWNLIGFEQRKGQYQLPVFGKRFWRAGFFVLILLSPASRGQRVENTSLQVPLEMAELPQLLSETGIFQNLETLEPEAGIIPYEPILAFWSDNAIKSRWVYIPYEEQIGFSQEGSWSFPTGSVWIKHFDLEMERGNPESRRKIETRLLVKTGFGTYGVSYQWNEAGTDATLVGDDAVPLSYDIVDNGESREQLWAIPSRADCIACHTFSGGIALSFNTWQLNHEIDIEGQTRNFLKYLGEVGILDTEIDSPEVLPRYSKAGDSEYSIDHQARSYLAVNCSYCHSPGGGPESDPFDARPFRNLYRTRMIDGSTNLDYGDSLVKLITRGSHELSAVWLNMSGTVGVNRMPPIATFERDLEGEALIERWINDILPDYLTYDEWQEQNFEDPNSMEASKGFDADGDGESNELEFVGRTNPNNANDRSRVEVANKGDGLELTYDATPFAEYQLEASEDLIDWDILDVSENAIRTLPEGESRIETRIPIDGEGNKARFIRVLAKER